MTETLKPLNDKIKTYLETTPRADVKLFSIMNLLMTGGLVEAAYRDNRGKTLSVMSGQKELGRIVTQAEAPGIAKTKVAAETSLRQPESWQALTQAAQWIFAEYESHPDSIPLIAFLFTETK